MIGSVDWQHALNTLGKAGAESALDAYRGAASAFLKRLGRSEAPVPVLRGGSLQPGPGTSHFDDQHKWLVVLDGECTLDHGAGSEHLGPGAHCYIPALTPHRRATERGCRVWMTLFRPGSLLLQCIHMNTDGSQQSWNPIRIDDGDRALAPAFDLLLNHWPTEILTTQRLSAAQVIWRWITHVLKRGQDQGSHDGGQAVVSLTRRLIEERHREADLSVEAIAAALQRNHSALTRTVRHYTGWSIAELIQQRRLAAAQALLRDQWRSIASIAEASGFGSARYFATVFKAWCGVTPSSYRKLGHLEPELNLHPKQDDPGLS